MTRWFGVLAIIFLLALAGYPGARNAYISTGDFYGLAATALSQPEELDGIIGKIISPDAAMWILKNLDYPYRRCTFLSESVGVCGMPRISYVGAGIGMGQGLERHFDLISFLVRRGDSLGAVNHEGLTPLHDAVLFKEKEYVTFLLEQGASVQTLTSAPGKQYDGLDAIEYAEFLLKKRNDPALAAILDILRKHAHDSSRQRDGRHAI